VIVAEGRSLRPSDLHPTGAGSLPDGCPFCLGNESQTPPEIRCEAAGEQLAEHDGSAAPWQIRVVPNSFAALRIEGNLDPSSRGLYNEMNGVGAHEVVIESPNHEDRLGDYSAEKLASILRVFRERVEDLHRDTRFQYVQIFRNYGAAAGASLRHPHSQLIALPIVPRSVHDELEETHHYFQRTGRCLLCDMLAQESAEEVRVVAENADFLAFTPFASKFSYELWVVPRTHGHEFQFIAEIHLRSLAELLHRVFWTLQNALGDPPFNFIIHSAPESYKVFENGLKVPQYYHWHIEIMPRISNKAGFEWGTGFHINSVMPEKAAEKLRAAAEAFPG